MIYEFDCESKLYRLITKYRVTFDLELEDKVATLNLFVVPTEYQNKNLASKIMELFCEWLDNNQIVCKLTASSSLGTDLLTLLNFYESYDFEEVEVIDSENVLLQRIPY